MRRKNFKEVSDYLSNINPNSKEIYKAISEFFGEDNIVPKPIENKRAKYKVVKIKPKDFSTRTFNLLMSYGLTSLSKFKLYKYESKLYCDLEGIGEAGMKEIRRFLYENNYRLLKDDE